MSGDIAKGLAPIIARMLTTLEKKVAPSHTALIVVDVQNDFCADGGAFHRDGVDLRYMQAVIPGLIQFIDKAREAGVMIIHVKTVHISGDVYYASDVWLEQWQRTGKGAHIKYAVCEDGTWGGDFCDGIKPLPGEYIVQKHRYSAFVNTDINVILRGKGIRTLIVTGVATNVCVEVTAKDAFMHDYYVVVPRDCAAGKTEELHNRTLESIAGQYGEIVDSSDIVKCWGK